MVEMMQRYSFPSRLGRVVNKSRRGTVESFGSRVEDGVQSALEPHPQGDLNRVGALAGFEELQMLTLNQI